MAAEFAAMLLAGPAPMPVRPRPMTEVTWHSIDLRTGRRGAPVLARSKGTVARILSEAKETTLDVTIWDNGQPIPEWRSATQPAWVMLLAVDQNDQPIWGGLVYKRTGPLLSPFVTLSMVTLEGYLDRRYINADSAFSNADQVSEIAQQVIQSTIAQGIQFTIDAPVSNWRRDREYLIDDDKTVFSVLSELAGLPDGIEFTVDLEWTDATHTVLNRIIRVRNRIGTAYLGGVGTESKNPPAVFQMPGAVVGGDFTEDYSSEHGANAVVAVSSGEGDTRPESLNWNALNVVAGYGGSQAKFEMRFTPATSLNDTDTLDQHAYRELREVWDGLIELTLIAHLDAAPQLHVDWWLGDDLGVVLTCPRFPERVDQDGRRFPGYVGVVRCIGWEINLDARTITPTVVELNEVQVVTE